MRSRRVGIGGAAFVGLLECAGCARAPELAPTFAAIRLRDHVIGVEERTVTPGPDGVVVRRVRTYADGGGETILWLDAAGAAREATSRTAGGDVRSWAAAGAPVPVLDESAALLTTIEAPRVVAVLDPAALVVREVALHRVEAEVRYTLDGLEGTLIVDGDHVVRHALGSLVVEAVADRPGLDGVSVESLLTLPAPALPGARSARTSSWTVDGETIVVQRPLPAEVPRATRAAFTAAMADGEGSCLPRSRALVAALRDQGFEAKGVVGLVYLADGRAPGLVPHAWVEVSLDGRVVPVDPTLGQSVADAARLVLADDGPDAPWRLLAALDARSVALVDLR